MINTLDEFTRAKNSALMLLEFCDGDDDLGRAFHYTAAALAEIQIIGLDGVPSPPSRATRIQSAIDCLEMAKGHLELEAVRAATEGVGERGRS
jgi:hypothetical protein